MRSLVAGVGACVIAAGLLALGMGYGPWISLCLVAFGVVLVGQAVKG